MRRLVRVTKEHIKLGKKHSCSKCPVALALDLHEDSRAIQGTSYYEVNSNNILLKAFNQELCFKPPNSVIEFIKKFDSGKPVKPFNFYFDF